MNTQATVEQREGEDRKKVVMESFPLEEVQPLNYQAALDSFSPEERQEILDLVRSIDVRKVDQVMHYAEVPLQETFKQCGDFLKDERGTQADQEVIAQVARLSKKASETYEDFNLALREPNFLQKTFVRISTRNKASQTQKIKESAITNYTLLMELKASCEVWLNMLREAIGKICDSAISDVETVTLLEKYMIAGRLAEERIVQDLERIQTQYQQTGLQRYAQEYSDLKEGYDIFALRMMNLEKSRVMYRLSLGQLELIKRSNRNVQITIHTQVGNSMALMGQQLRNAVLNAKTREVLVGQKAISKLNDELIRDVSKNIGLTTEEAEKLLYAGFYDVEAARVAIQTVIHSCQAIQKTAEEMLPKMKADMEQLGELVRELEPCVNSTQIVEESTFSGKLTY